MRLVIVDKGGGRRDVELVEGRSLLVGRGRDAELRIADPGASRRHCRIDLEDGVVRAVDQGSSSGTIVNGETVDESVIRPGDVIRIGDTELRVVQSPEDATTIKTGPTNEKPRSPRDLAELVGRTIHHYELVQEVARGRSGIVFRGRHVEKGSDVAVKVLWPEIARDDEDRRRFVRGMKTMQPVRHPNLVRVMNAGWSERICWYSMEFVEGESLARVIERIGTAGMLDWKYAWRVGVQVARGLEAAAEHDIVHRNITPENILVRESDKLAKLGDMMLAKSLEGSQVEQVTRPGELVGELAWMPPERTSATAEADTRSDVYSLGATLYGLLTGRPPFEGRSLPELVARIRNDEPEPPKRFQLSVNDMFEGIVLRMIAKRPEDRFESPTALLRDLERVGRYNGLDS